MQPKDISALVVGDNPDFLAKIIEKLRTTGIVNVDSAETRDQAYSFLAQRPYNLLVLDSVLGPQIAEQARAAGQAPVVVGYSSARKDQFRWERGSGYYFLTDDLLVEGLGQILERKLGITLANN